MLEKIRCFSINSLFNFQLPFTIVCIFPTGQSFIIREFRSKKTRFHFVNLCSWKILPDYESRWTSNKFPRRLFPDELNYLFTLVKFQTTARVN